MQLLNQEANAIVESRADRFPASSAIVIVLCLALQVCRAEQQQTSVQQNGVRSLGSRIVGVVDIKSLPDTIGIEHQDRINRFNRMAALVGIQPPVVDDMQLGAGQVPGFNYPIPVVRVRFDERVLFDFNKETIRPEATKILDVMAENMKRDVPDSQLTILGHTDAIGSDTYNFDLSRRRALSVMQELYSRGVRLSQMSTVAVGKTQPVASNRTDEGRARNRRVEFMISASEQANLTLVSKRRIIAEWLTVDQAEQPASKLSAALVVLAPVLSAFPSQGPSLQLAQTGSVQAQQPMHEAEAARVAPQPDIKLMPLKDFHQAQLNHEFEL
jgi:outer membrane protein OmpA-like peptidoglycan-associated protein